MNIAIVGAGLAGISTALELARDGHQVTVYEQMNATAEAASFAPGGWLSPCAAPSLAIPGAGMPLKLLQSGPGLLQSTGMIGSPAWRWLRQWKQHEKQATQQGNLTQLQALHTLCAYSQNLRWRDDAEADLIAERKSGALVLLRNPKEVNFWQQQLPMLQAQPVACQLIDAAHAQAMEPGLGQDMTWTHAVHFPDGESINPRLWTQHLRLQALELGVHIHTGIQVQALHSQPTGVEIAGQRYPHDAIVVCTGASRSLLARLSLPVLPLWGYSVTAPVRDALLAPRTAVMDWQQQATISRMGQRVRITAGLELASTADAAHHAPTLQRMYRLLNDWFPGGIQLSSAQVQVWRGCRGQLPDGLPAVGSSSQQGIWLNLAHGSHGASLATGCARALADMLAGHAPQVDMQAFDPQRF